MPLEKRIDFLTLHTGGKFPVPFDMLLIFATNLEPRELVEEAFLRRIHYKIQIARARPGRSTPRSSAAAATSAGIRYDHGAVLHIYQEYYGRQSITPRGCHPRDILDHLVDIARFRGQDRSLATRPGGPGLPVLLPGRHEERREPRTQPSGTAGGRHA